MPIKQFAQLNDKPPHFLISTYILLLLIFSYRKGRDCIDCLKSQFAIDFIEFSVKQKAIQFVKQFGKCIGNWQLTCVFGWARVSLVVKSESWK